MPILGSSIIRSDNIINGPTGPQGNQGPLGPTGPTGTTQGVTGATGVYISFVESDLNTNTIIFKTSNGKQYVLSGFTGPTGSTFGYSKNSSGNMVAESLVYLDGSGPQTENQDGSSAFLFKGSPKGLCFSAGFTGMTFYLRGIISGGGVTLSLSPDKSEIWMEASKTVSGSIARGDTSSNYVAYISNNSLTRTGIYVDENNHLNFGLTGIPSGITLSKVVTDFIEFRKTQGTRVWGLEPSVILDLSGAPNHIVNTPIGITAFSCPTTTGIRQEYTLFVNGADVWQLPSNLYFMRGITSGIKNYDFLNGLNILHIWTDNGGITFNGVFIERGIGFNSSNFVISQYGSCKDPNGICTGFTSKGYCETIFGEFKPLQECTTGGAYQGYAFSSETGACCCGITGCVDGVDAAFCGKIGGVFFGGQTCKTNDSFTNSRTTDNDSANKLCFNNCKTPVACCTPTQGCLDNVTEETCRNVYEGEPFFNKTCASLGDCTLATTRGFCLSRGVCTPNVRRGDCVDCGAWNVSACPTGTLHSTTIQFAGNPSTFVVKAPGPTETSSTFTISGSISGGSTSKYYLTGNIATAGGSSIDIFAPQTGCFRFSATKSGGAPIDANTVLLNGDSINVTITVDKTSCGGSDIGGTLTLNLMSCERASSVNAQVSLLYSVSPCTCIDANPNTDNNSIVIPFKMMRYCIDCTRGVTYDFSFGDERIEHVPYPVKEQEGVITICPPITNIATSPGTSCNIIEDFCVYFGAIKELNGCTVSSSFYSNPAPAGCYHAEYNEPSAPNVYWWGNLRSCSQTSNCRISRPWCWGAGYGGQCRNTNCKFCAGNMDDYAIFTLGCPSEGFERFWPEVIIESTYLTKISKEFNIDETKFINDLSEKIIGITGNNGTPIGIQAHFNPSFQNTTIKNGGKSEAGTVGAAKNDCDNCQDELTNIIVPTDGTDIGTASGNRSYTVYSLITKENVVCPYQGESLCRQIGSAGLCQNQESDTCIVDTNYTEYNYYLVIIKQQNNGTAYPTFECANAYLVGSQIVQNREGGIGCYFGVFDCDYSKSDVSIVEFAPVRLLGADSLDDISGCSNHRKLKINFKSILPPKVTNIDNYERSWTDYIQNIVGGSAISSQSAYIGNANRFLNKIFCSSVGANISTTFCSKCAGNCNSSIPEKLKQFVGRRATNFSCNPVTEEQTRIIKITPATNLGKPTGMHYIEGLPQNYRKTSKKALLVRESDLIGVASNVGKCPMWIGVNTSQFTLNGLKYYATDNFYPISNFYDSPTWGEFSSREMITRNVFYYLDNRTIQPGTKYYQYFIEETAGQTYYRACSACLPTSVDYDYWGGHDFEYPDNERFLCVMKDHNIGVLYTDDTGEVRLHKQVVRNRMTNPTANCTAVENGLESFAELRPKIRITQITNEADPDIPNYYYIKGNIVYVETSGQGPTQLFALYVTRNESNGELSTDQWRPITGSQGFDFYDIQNENKQDQYLLLAAFKQNYNFTTFEESPVADFDLIKIPAPGATTTRREPVSPATDIRRKNINGSCLDIECAADPDFCINYEDCQ